ncbi:DUF1772 domain-containing protein [Microbacterium sp. 2FI]|uniref:anthrone oxygenase family protein n=1 Tax=Microbacterium sp. 2FI TaxID=2502193 RepID=UPI0010F53444|nr:DUF1772 domain-containing protein [Microbacterium sp. 2FI]
MGEVLHISAIIMLVADGLWAGVIFFYAVERVNLWRRMPIDQFVVDFRRSLYRADPLQPIMGGVAMIAAVVFALNAPATAAVLAWVGAALILFVIVMSIAFPERINSLFRRRAEGEAPPQIEQLRTRWRRLHYTRTPPAILSLVVLAAAAVWS